MFMKKGFTLLEISLSIVLLWILIFSTFQIVQAEKLALQTARENNFALFFLEAQKNRILLEIDKTGRFSEVEQPRNLLPTGFSFDITSDFRPGSIVKMSGFQEWVFQAAFLGVGTPTLFSELANFHEMSRIGKIKRLGIFFETFLLTTLATVIGVSCFSVFICWLRILEATI